MTHPGRMFPIQGADPIPWDAAEKAYVTYARLFGKQQSLERLAERGGFGLHEWACLYEGHGPLGYHSVALADRCVMRALAAVGARPDALIQRGLPPAPGDVNELEWRRDQMERNWPKNQYSSLLTNGEWESAQSYIRELQAKRDELHAALRGLDAGPPPPDEAEACAKAVCRWCREGWVAKRENGGWLHYPDYAPEPVYCVAAAIQERIRVRASPSEGPPDCEHDWYRPMQPAATNVKVCRKCAVRASPSEGEPQKSHESAIDECGHQEIP